MHGRVPVCRRPPIGPALLRLNMYESDYLAVVAHDLPSFICDRLRQVRHRKDNGTALDVAYAELRGAYARSSSRG